jgi:hypothetical protein
MSKEVIIIYDNCGNTQAYALPAVSDEDYEKLAKCHCKMAQCVENSEDDEELLSDWLPEWLEQFTPVIDIEDGKEIDLSVFANGNPQHECHIIVTGFLS